MRAMRLVSIVVGAFLFVAWRPVSVSTRSSASPPPLMRHICRTSHPGRSSPPSATSSFSAGRQLRLRGGDANDESHLYTYRALEVLERAQSKAKVLRNAELTPVHLFVVMLEDKKGIGREILASVTNEERKNDVIELVTKNLERWLANQRSERAMQGEEMSLSPKLQNLLYKAVNDMKGEKVDVFELFVYSAEMDEVVRSALEEAGVNPKKLSVAGRRLKAAKNEQSFTELEKYSKDLIAEARAGKLDPVIGREDEIRRLVQILCRRTKNNPVLVGEPGVGKTAIVEGLAQRILDGDVASTLKECKLFTLDFGSLVANTAFRGNFEQRMRDILEEIEKSEGKVILFIDELHLLIGAGNEKGEMDAANLLKPALARGQIRCIGATTYDEYRKYIESDGALERRFQMIHVGEPSVPDAISILRGIKEKFEVHHGVRISDAALVQACELSSRYITMRFLPDKAIDLVDEACSSIRVQLDSKPEQIDRLERRRLQLDVELRVLRKDLNDPSSALRAAEIQAQVDRINMELGPLQAAYKEEQFRRRRLHDLRQQIEQTKLSISELERRYLLDRVAELKYDVLPALQQELHNLTSSSAGTLPIFSGEVVGPDEVRSIVSRWTGIPVARLGKTERSRLLELKSEIQKRVVGQEEAVDAVSTAILRSRVGISPVRLPSCSALFLGPTGVGKTELSKALASQLFDDEKQLIRIDMSEYMEQHAVSRLIGSPPGYVGHESGGQLTEAVRKKPYAVVLFDEIEKAHPSVLDVLLQVLDDGRLTDGKGKVVDFANTIIIMTSNIGSQHLAEEGPVDESCRQQIMREVKSFLRPEFLNRIDDIVIFQRLGIAQLREVARKLVREMAEPLKEEHKLELSCSDAALDLIVSLAYDPAYGARPIRRYLYKIVGTQLAYHMVEQKELHGSTVHIDEEGGQLKIHFEKPEDEQMSAVEEQT
mmetsp:Transcript_31203/g.70219  ORF Transcript_31203/g.70219 Transcript_31203/m.70219 type:complete len:943 (-) Transcript_31203:118-2946(-)